MINIQIKDNSQGAKDLIKFLRALPYVKIEEKSTYNPEFVKKIKAAEKGKSIPVDAKNIWESIK